MQPSRRSFFRELFSCKSTSTVLPYQSQPSNIGNGTMIPTASMQNQIHRNRHDSIVSLDADNLLADVDLNDANNLYRNQVDALWPKESSLLADAFQKCLLNNKDTNCVRVLDVGCGTGELLTRLVGDNGLFEKMVPSDVKLILLGVELDRSVYEFCQKRCRKLKHKDNIEISIINGTATALPLESNSFDLILNRHMLHCLPRNDIPIVINETWRLSKMNGIIHFLVEDIEMIYTSVNNDQTLLEQYQLWSDGIYQTGAQLGIDLRLGRKIPSVLMKSGFTIQSIDYVSVDTFHCSRSTLYDMFHLWYKMYLDAYKRNRIDFKYKAGFQNFLKVVQDKNEYICWNVPIIQAVKVPISTVH